jgi:hypothetical protein
LKKKIKKKEEGGWWVSVRSSLQQMQLNNNKGLNKDKR